MYEDTVQNIAKVEAEEVPSILTSEVERSRESHLSVVCKVYFSAFLVDDFHSHILC